MITECLPVYFDIETVGLKPRKNKIVLIQLLREINQGEYELTLLKEWELDEKRMLKQFFDYLDELPKFTPVISYNGTIFDIPYIIVRAEINNINDYWESYRNNVWYDIIKYIDGRTVGFYNLAKHYGYKWKCKYSGRDIPTFYEEKRFDDICSHGIDDVEALRHICEKESSFLNVLYWGDIYPKLRMYW